MLINLLKASGPTFALTVLVAGTAYAGGDLVTYGTVGNCAAGQTCTLAPSMFRASGGGGDTPDAASTAVQPHGRTAHQGAGPHHGGGMGGGDMGTGGHGGGGMGGGGHGGGGHGGGGMGGGGHGGGGEGEE